MPQLGIELAGHIPDTGLPELSADVPYLFAHVSHWVHGTGEKQHRRAGVHLPQILRVRKEREAMQHLPEQPCGRHTAAQRIRQIAVHVFRVAGEPVKIRTVGGKAPVIGGKGQPACQCAGQDVRPLSPGLPVYENFSGSQNGGGRLSGAHDDGALHSAGMADQEGSGQEGTHGVAHQEYRHIGEILPHQLVAGEEICLYKIPAAPGAEVEPGSAGGHGRTMPQVIVSCHGNAPLRQKRRQCLVTQDVLRHAVGDLQDGPDRTVWDPVHGVQVGFPVGGGKGEFTLEHGKKHLFVIYCHQSSKICSYDSTTLQKIPAGWRREWLESTF